MRKRSINRQEKAGQTALHEVFCARCNYPVLIDGRFDKVYCDRCTQYRVMKLEEAARADAAVVKAAKEAARAGK